MANRLVTEQSPYLLQHAHNPVDWYSWSDEPFLLAQKQNKPLLVSIGYSACHWCHVMERESFENHDVAAYMNEHFVCIKIDREEHPDVDHLYMDAVQAITGGGGWPLNVFVTPDRIPFYGGTYYPPRPMYQRLSWLQLLEHISHLWNARHDEVTEQAAQMKEYLQKASLSNGSAGAHSWNLDDCRQIADTLLKQADKEKGGFGNAPKFPGTMAISFLLEHYHFTKYEPALQHALHSLDAMLEGGIYDQLGGGFARYATDNNWLIPHFEKMLYDNALLISSLCDAYSITGELRYKKIIEETIAFIERELKNESGGYYSALDADSEGVEGKFYTWTWEDWKAATGEHDPVVAEYFGVTPQGNWEEVNILHVAKDVALLASENKITVEEIEKRINDVKNKLFVFRSKRVRPSTDDKSLLSWNALMNISLSKAGLALKNDNYLRRAREHADWMLTHFHQGDLLLHVWKNGIARIPAKLDDYAYLIQALLQLASACGENEWIVKAAGLTEKVLADFGHRNQGGVFYYYTSQKQNDIPVRKVDLYDSVTPSANAAMAQNLWTLGMCMEKTEWLETSSQMLQNVYVQASHHPYFFSYWATLIQRYSTQPKIIVCTGKGAMDYQISINGHYMPNTYTVTSQKEISELPILEKKFFTDKITIFVCNEQACLAPVNSIDELLRVLKQ